MEEQKHGGDRYRNQILYDASVNVNPLGMPESVRNVLADTLPLWSRYPDSRCQALIQALAVCHQIREEQILCGNGAADLIWRLCMVKAFRRGLVLAPSFSEYEAAMSFSGCETSHYFLQEEHGFCPDLEGLCQTAGSYDVIFFCNPNNPTGVLVKRPQLEALAAVCEAQGVWLVVDECFNGLCDDPEGATLVPLLEKYPHLLILNAFTKTYGMAGLRLGYLMGADEELIKQLEQAGQPWSVSYPAQEAGQAALLADAYLKESRRMIRQERDFLKEELSSMGFTVYPSQSNFLLFSADWERRGCVAKDSLYERMKRQKILIRDCRSFIGLGAGFYRVCTGTPEADRLLAKTMRGEVNK